MQSFLLHLLRHGAPERPGRMLGRTDCPSTAEGTASCIAQAQLLAVESIFCSGLSRAQAPAQAIAAAKGLPLFEDPRWREMDFGAWEDMSPEDIDARALARFHDDPDNCPPPGGERWGELVERVAQSTSALPMKDTLIITHGGPMRAALAHLCGLSHRQIWAFDIPYAALLSIRIWRDDRPFAQIVGLRG